MGGQSVSQSQRAVLDPDATRREAEATAEVAAFEGAAGVRGEIQDDRTEATGIEAPSHIDGFDLGPLLDGSDTSLQHTRLFWDTGHETAMRDGRWKLVRPFVTRNIPKCESTAPSALYDLATDPLEINDVSAQHSGRVDRMTKALGAWSRDVEAARTR